MIYQLECAAPTPTQEGIMVTLQWLASAKVTGRIADFDQCIRTRRQEKTNLPTKLPPGVTHPKVGDSCCVLKQRSMDLRQDRAG